MTRLTGIIFCLCILLGCSNKSKVPADILKESRMKEVLWDVFLADSWARQSASRDTTVVLSDKVKLLTREALKRHHLTEKEFFNSYSWYVRHPELLNPILDSLYNQKSARPELSDDDNPEHGTDKNPEHRPMPHRELKIEK